MVVKSDTLAPLSKITAKIVARQLLHSIRRAQEITEAWCDTFRPDVVSRQDIEDPTRWRCPPEGYEPDFLPLISSYLKATKVIFKQGIHSSVQDLMACLQSVHVVSSDTRRRRVVLVGISIDAITCNPLSWTWLVNRFPGISFMVAIFLPPDDNHANVPSCLTSASGATVRWSLYSVDPFAALYHPLPHKQSEGLEMPGAHVDTGTYHAHVLDAHKVFIVKSLAAFRWRQHYPISAAIGWV
jgi:hypothetical protein